MSERQKYEVLEAGFIAGTYRRVGEQIEMHAKQAQYYLPPHENRLRPVAGVGHEPPRTRRRSR